MNKTSPKSKDLLVFMIRKIQNVRNAEQNSGMEVLSPSKTKAPCASLARIWIILSIYQPGMQQ